LLDVGALREESHNDGNFVDLYVQSIAIKYPLLARKFTSMKTMDKLLLLKRIAPVVGSSTTSMHQKMQQ
jgi:hypothetical protein